MRFSNLLEGYLMWLKYDIDWLIQDQQRYTDINQNI